MKHSFSFKRVMTIDDNEMDRMLMEIMLQRTGFAEQVFSCESANDGLEYLRENKVLPQIIFLDINMPEMDGFEFLDEFNKLHEKVKNNCIIIMLSHTSHPLEIKKAEENKHVMLFLSKPLTKGKLEVITSAFSAGFKNNDGLVTHVNSRKDND